MPPYFFLQGIQLYANRCRHLVFRHFLKLAGSFVNFENNNIIGVLIAYQNARAGGINGKIAGGLTAGESSAYIAEQAAFLVDSIDDDAVMSPIRTV